MNYSLYNIYLTNTIELARSMIIKLDWVAHAMNRRVTDYGGTIPDVKTEWRYYNHLAGKYHELDTNMMIQSLDDSSLIVFNKENLEVHKKTRSIYLYSKAYVDALKARYPEQTNLILGILNPIDMQTAINAPDGTVLWYDTEKVETQEYRLIAEVENWITGYLYRYIMESLVESDDLYTTDIIGKLYAFLPVRIMDIRDKYIRTSQTHSFHIIAYLASKQRLDEFTPYLTLSQMMFLYRNILYIERHTGMEGTFEFLTEHLLTERNLPLYQYTLRQKDMDIENDVLSPVATFDKTKLNLDTGLSSRDLDLYDVDSVLYKSLSLAKDNTDHYEEYVEEAEELTSLSSISKLPTKVLEVSAIDPEDISPVKFAETIIYEWMHLATEELYTATLDVINPLNGDTLQMSPKETFLLFMYAHTAGFHGVEMTTIPTFIAKGVVRNRWVDDSEYLDILMHDRFKGWKDELNFYSDTSETVFNTLVTAESFIERCLIINDTKSIRHQFTFQPHRFTTRSGRRSMYNYTYPDIFCDMTTDRFQTYDDFFNYIALDRDMMSIDSWIDLAMTILDTSTLMGTLGKISLSDIQSAMVKILKRLSSYTIQFIEEVVSGEVTTVEPLSAIIGNSFESTRGDSHVNGVSVNVSTTSMSSRDTASCNIKNVKVTDVRIIDDKHVDVNLYVKPIIKEATRVSFKVFRPAMTVTAYDEVSK